LSSCALVVGASSARSRIVEMRILFIGDEFVGERR
jgi:hypothetical protein